MRTEGVAETVLFVYTPVLVLVLVALIWARYTRVPKLATTLNRSALVWLVVLTGVFVVGLVTAMTCQGNFMHGYSDCTLVPQGVAAASFTIGFLTFCAAALYTLVLFAIGAIAEIKARTRG